MKHLELGPIPSVWKKNMKTTGSSGDHQKVSFCQLYILFCHCCPLTSVFYIKLCIYCEKKT